MRWRAGQVALGLAGVMTLLAFLRPLAPTTSPRVRLAVTLALGLGAVGAALLASLKGRGRAEQLAFYAFLTLSLDGLGQVLSPLGWPDWPLLSVFVGAVAVAEPLAPALSVAALAAALGAADALQALPPVPERALAGAFGYAALALAINRALRGEKRRLARSLAELARLKHGIEQLDEIDHAALLPKVSSTAGSLRVVSEEARRARQAERARTLDHELGQLVALARRALDVHAVLYFEVSRERELSLLRAADGPPTLAHDSVVPLTQDPFGFVLERKATFYATDFPRLLWALPYYKGEVKVGSLIAVPVRAGDVVFGVLVADRLEIQSLTGREPEVLQGFAGLLAEVIQGARASLGREELGAEFKAVYEVSRRMAALVEPKAVRQRLLQSARDLVALEGAAVVMTDEAETRYRVEDALGWAAEYEGREVALSEKTWAGQVVRSGDSYLLDRVAGRGEGVRFLVLDEGSARGESLLAHPLRARNRTLGAILVTGRPGAFDATSHRVLEILANQAAATLSVIQLKERHKALAARDGLTGLYNRRSFDELLAQAVAREERKPQGGFALLMLDLDHFKKLNDTFGHPAGDAALRHAAQTLGRGL
ncbi:MAG TPA: sensor domain-containing diguanylate cyclase, partial [Vicinamibacteria bacterium]|nr:sensor domain-containing diguanylate cyclase [Vicinamibacteria bacterium]